MSPSRKIAHKIADILIKSATNSLDPQRMRSVYISSSQMANPHGSELDPEKSGAVLSIWIDSIVEHVSSKKDSIISDYVLDLIKNIQSYFDSKYNEDELKYIVEVVENPVFKKLISDENVFKIVSDAKETFNNNVIKEMQSEECLNIMQKKLHDLLVSNDFDDNFHTSG